MFSGCASKANYQKGCEKLDGSAQGGAMLTPPVQFSGKHLFVNAGASGGEIGTGGDGRGGDGGGGGAPGAGGASGGKPGAKAVSSRRT